MHMNIMSSIFILRDDFYSTKKKIFSQKLEKNTTVTQIVFEKRTNIQTSIVCSRKKKIMILLTIRFKTSISTFKFGAQKIRMSGPKSADHHEKLLLLFSSRQSKLQYPLRCQ